jgi:pyridoxine 5-phosphate synthase
VKPPRTLVADLDALVWLRARMDTRVPDVASAAVLARLGGADGVALSLGDAKISLERDARVLREIAGAGFSVVLPARSDTLKLALEFRPESVVLTGETSGPLGAGALDLLSPGLPLGDLIRSLGEARIRVSARVRPDPQQIKAAHRLCVPGIQMTASAVNPRQGEEPSLRELEDGARLAAKIGLHAGVTGVTDREHLRALAAIDAIAEFSLGAPLIAEAVLVGMERAARELAACIR